MFLSLAVVDVDGKELLSAAVVFVVVIVVLTAHGLENGAFSKSD